MPNSGTHDTITVITAAGVLAVEEYYHLGQPLLSLVVSGAVLFSGLMFSPDLDLNSRPYQRWGPFKGLWWPYQKALPHRHLLSHGLLIGTICRLIYFTVVSSVMLMACASVYRLVRNETIDISGQAAAILEWLFGLCDALTFPQMAAILGGLWLGELAHVVPDYTSSWWKRCRRPKARRRRKRAGNRRVPVAMEPLE
jgi:uncharacterized metal-binding protein